MSLIALWSLLFQKTRVNGQERTRGYLSSGHITWFMTFQLMNGQVLARINDNNSTKPLNFFIGVEVI
jgi:hypothetical protein